MIDSREQVAFRFPRGTLAIVEGLPSGDYSLEGLSHFAAAERKSLPDLVACCGYQRERFERELARLSLLPLAVVIVEASIADVAARRYPGVQEPAAIIGSTLDWAIDFKVPFLWGSDPRCAAALCLHWLCRAERRYEEEYALLRLRGDPAMAEAACKRAPRGKPRGVRPRVAKAGG